MGDQLDDRSAIAWEYCEVNPVKGVTFLATARTETPDLYAFFLAGLRTGCRIGELFALEWGDVDSVLGRIHVQRNWTHGRLGTPKSGGSRFIPMTQDLDAALQAHKHLKGKLVFSTREGEMLGHASITTTQRYAHSRPSATADFVRVLEERMNEIAAHRPPTPRN